MKPCAVCGEANADRARFCQNCGSSLTEPSEHAAETRKVVTVVFADVTGSTALGERLDPETLRRVMSRYFDEMSGVIERHGGSVEKFIGDAVMAVFGIPRLHEDDALRAVRAARDMRDALRELNAELEYHHGVGLEVRIGVNTGEVVAGKPRSGQQFVMGDPVNIAARLEQAASPGEILVGEDTHRLVRDAVQIRSVDSLELKGKAEPVRAFRLIEVLEDTAGHVRHLDSPMVGREGELEMLQRVLDRVITKRTAHLFTLLGPAGVGKSRLIREFVSGHATSARFLRGRCLSYGEGITFFPLVEIVQEAAGVERTDDVATGWSKLAALAEGVEDRDRIVALVAGLLSWAEPVTAEEAYWALRKLFEHLARQGPLVVVFDDIHWAEPAFLDLIEYLADWTRDAPLLLVCVARPELLELRTSWAGGKLNATTILLEALPGDEVSRLVDNLLGQADIPSTARTRILDAAEGNPLFVEEILGMLIDDRLLRFQDGRWRAVEDLAHVTVPPTIQLLLAARLDRLDAEERAVIERGAVEGKLFHVGAVTKLAPEALRPQVRPRLLALARKELIRPDRGDFAGEDAFRFRHLLIRDAAYQALSKEQRADLHERFAVWLEHAAGERIAEYEEILAYHLEQAYRYRAELGALDETTKRLGRTAATRLIVSADRARERGHFASAQQLLTAATEVSDGSLKSRALFELAYTLLDMNHFSESVEVAKQAIEAAEAAEDLAIAARAHLVFSEALGQIDPSHTYARAHQEAAAALGTLQRAGDDAGIVQATLTLAVLLFHEGRCAESVEMTSRLLDRAPDLPSSDRRRIALTLATGAHYGPFSAEEGLRAHATASSLVKDSIITQAQLDNMQTVFLAMEGKADESRAEGERAERRWLDIGIPALSAYADEGRGEAERFLGRPDLAAEYFGRCIEIWDSLGETSFNSTMAALLALALCDAERFDDAERFVQRSRELSAEDDFASQAVMRMARARILSHRGNHEDALATIDEAIAINESTDYLAFVAESHEIRAVVLLADGRVDEARAEFEQAAELYERKGIVPWARRVRHVLEGLGHPSP